MAARRGNEKAPRNVPRRTAAGGSEEEEGGPAARVSPRGEGAGTSRAGCGCPSAPPRVSLRGGPGPPTLGGVGWAEGGMLVPEALKCPFASSTLLLSNARLGVRFSFPDGKSLGLAPTGLSSVHTSPMPYHCSVSVPVMSDHPGLTKGSEVPWGPVGGASQQLPQGRCPTEALGSLLDKTEEPPASSWGQPLGRLSSPFMEGPGQDGLPQELFISPPFLLRPSPPPDPARPPETLP